MMAEQSYLCCDVILSLMCNAFGIYVVFKFNTIFFDRKDISKKLEAVVYMGCLALLSIVQEVWSLPILTVGSNLVLCFLVSCIYKGSWRKKAILSVFINTLFLLFEMVSYLLIFRYDLISMEFVTGFVSTLVSYNFVIILEHAVKSRSGENIHRWHWAVIFIVSAISIYLIFILALSNEQMKYVRLGVISLLTINFLIFYLYDELSEAFEAKYEKSLLDQKNQAYLNELEFIKSSNDDLRKLRHDFRNHLLILNKNLKLNAEDFEARWTAD
ncbi:hypothetical protein [Aminipila luticellarii]|uniref:Uncharacterized protein n=1 Tax=Aminipila luticellarii TaxID=2507160 RepID=A0A410PY45_9FIRM|nr:hypothetical protein [Aminipila luticellarii]QAT43902.1 hypothetical protein EQM06_12085 [Aminipila luticellarii]